MFPARNIQFVDSEDYSQSWLEEDISHKDTRKNTDGS